MTTSLISYPFRLGSAGYVVVKPDDSDEYFAEELGVLILTQPGERHQVPLYGLNDPTFSQVDPNELILKVGLFGPPVRINGFSYDWQGPSEQDVIVEFEPLYDQNAALNTR